MASGFRLQSAMCGILTNDTAIGLPMALDAAAAASKRTCLKRGSVARYCYLRRAEQGRLPVWVRILSHFLHHLSTGGRRGKERQDAALNVAELAEIRQ